MKKSNPLTAAVSVLREQGPAGLVEALLHRLATRNRERRSGPVTDAWSSYLNWLTFANPGMLTRGNVHCFDYAIRHLPSDAPLVEIGSFCGLSTNVLTYLKEKHGKANRLFSCDKWEFEGAGEGGALADSATVTHAEYREFVRESFRRNVGLFSRNDLPWTIEVFSDEFFALWAESSQARDVFGRGVQLGGPISFAYIDGNHTYDFARRDFENCDRFLESGGFLLFDDSGDGSGWEVCRVVREVKASGRYELLARNPNYFFRKK